VTTWGLFSQKISLRFVSVIGISMEGESLVIYF